MFVSFSKSKPRWTKLTELISTFVDAGSWRYGAGAFLGDDDCHGWGVGLGWLNYGAERIRPAKMDRKKIAIPM